MQMEIKNLENHEDKWLDEDQSIYQMVMKNN